MLNDSPLKYQDKAKYLGATLHCRLDWKPQILEVCEKTKKTLFALNSVIGKNGVFHQKLHTGYILQWPVHVLCTLALSGPLDSITT